ncbi:MAG: hypothetical protein WDW38_000286 [Sanguina aurantia]
MTPEIEVSSSAAGSCSAASTALRSRRPSRCETCWSSSGPAFVKIGQALSSRPDVLPPVYLLQMELLQDRIPPFPTDQAMKVIAAELGRPFSEVYSTLSTVPVAAASLGQVYRGRLVEGGQEVAVKVQRPGVYEQIALDVYILRGLAKAIRSWRKVNTDLPALVDEWAGSLFRELDYRQEGANAANFKRMFARLPEVFVPAVYPQFTSKQVLTMEWVEGERLRTASAAFNEASGSMDAPMSAAGSGGAGGVSGLSPQALEDLRLVEVGVRCSLEQILEEGVYHADPHPGNLLKMKDGRLAYLDFGMMGAIDLPVRQGLIRATLHLVNREYDALAEDFITLGLLPPGSDKATIVPAITRVFQEALKNGVTNLSFGQLSGDLGRSMYQYSFRIPPYYTLLVRSLTVLEGIALASDKDYKVLSAAYPWVARRLLTDKSPELRATLRTLLYKDGRFQFSRLESLMQQALKMPPLPPRNSPKTTPMTVSNSPTTSMAATTTAASAAAAAAPAKATAAQLVSSRGSSVGAVSGGGGGSSGGAALQLLLGEEGDFVREIVVEELAKGLDAAWRLAADALVDDAKLRLKQVLDLSPIPLNALTQWIFPSAPTPALPVNVNVNNNGGGGGGSAGGGGGSGSVRITDSLADYSIDEDFSSVSTTGIMGGGGVGGGVLPAQDPALLRQLMDLVPKLADLEDRKQLDGLMRLSTILFKISGFDTSATAAAAASSIDGSDPRSTFATKTSSSGRSSSSASAVPDAVGSAVSSIQQAALLLRWLGTEVSSLPAESQRQAIQIPVDLISKVSSRVAARTLRSVFTTLPSAASPFPFPSISFPAASTSIPLSPRQRPNPHHNNIISPWHWPNLPALSHHHHHCRCGYETHASPNPNPSRTPSHGAPWPDRQHPPPPRLPPPLQQQRQHRAHPRHHPWSHSRQRPPQRGLGGGLGGIGGSSSNGGNGNGSSSSSRLPIAASSSPVASPPPAGVLVSPSQMLPPTPTQAAAPPPPPSAPKGVITIDAETAVSAPQSPAGSGASYLDLDATGTAARTATIERRNL